MTEVRSGNLLEGGWIEKEKRETARVLECSVFTNMVMLRQGYRYVKMHHTMYLRFVHLHVHVNYLHLYMYK